MEFADKEYLFLILLLIPYLIWFCFTEKMVSLRYV